MVLGLERRSGNGYYLGERVGGRVNASQNHMYRRHALGHSGDIGFGIAAMQDQVVRDVGN